MKKRKSQFFEKVYNLHEYNHPHELDLPKKPYIIDIELTNNCNLSCIFCDRQTMKREKGYMDIGVFKKLADEASKMGVIGFRFIRWGEHYLHPGIFDAVHLS
jgi:MoaA/NifB/PqqE/SkfB family radical SAM enzyme